MSASKDGWTLCTMALEYVFSEWSNSRLTHGWHFFVLIKNWTCCIIKDDQTDIWLFSLNRYLALVLLFVDSLRDSCAPIPIVCSLVPIRELRWLLFCHLWYNRQRERHSLRNARTSMDAIFDEQAEQDIILIQDVCGRRLRVNNSPPHSPAQGAQSSSKLSLT